MAIDQKTLLKFAFILSLLMVAGLALANETRVALVYTIFTVGAYIMTQDGTQVPLLPKKTSPQAILLGVGALVGGYLYVNSGGFVMGVPVLTLFAISGVTTFVSVILAPIIEELFTRNLALDLMGLGKYLGVIIASGVFTALHYWAYGSGNIVAFSLAFVFSVISSVVTFGTGGLLWSIVLHAVINAATLSRVYGFSVGI